MHPKVLASISIAGLVCAGSAWAQFRGNPREAATSRFEAAAPGIGEPLPDIVVHDRTGQELRLRELVREHYTVLVLGCLT